MSGKLKITGVFMAFLLIIIFKLDSCITPFDPDIDKYEKSLVVEGILTNLPGTCSVKLSHSYPYDAKHYSTVSDASVSIIDYEGNITPMHLAGDGLYQPDDSCFTGIVGMGYRLKIITADGEVYESDLEKMSEPVEIGDVSYKVEETAGKMGLQFFVSTNDPLNKSHYYSWSYTETWEFMVPYQSNSSYLDEIKVCYKNSSSKKILIETTTGYREDRVIDFPLFYIDNSTNRLSFKYSVLVRQYVLPEKTYQFYRNLKEINENTGTLFDRTPVLTSGNIICTSSSGRPVLGNFQVSGASEKRIFIRNEQLPAGFPVATEYEYCQSAVFNRDKEKNRIDSLLSRGWVGMDTITEDTGDVLIGLVISRSCFDCTAKGTTRRPDYWDDDISQKKFAR